jgi:hypothetical protein
VSCTQTGKVCPTGNTYKHICEIIVMYISTMIYTVLHMKLYFKPIRTQVVPVVMLMLARVH